jgi:DNA-binding XRE family transcriptional regulator
MSAKRPADDLDDLRAALVDLTPAQALAVDALATGSTQSEAAEIAGVTRETVNRWVNHHPGFRAALDRYRHALAEENATAAGRIRGKALAIVERHLDDGADLPTALAVLRAVPAPDLARLDFAEEDLAEQLRRIADTVPYPPAPRLPNGQVNFLDSLVNCDTINADHAERAQRLAVERLAAVAGVSRATVDL